MKKTDLAYMAGLFDGEGTVSIVKPKDKCHRLHVSIGSTDEWVCQSFKMMFGGTITKLKLVQGTRGYNRQAWKWSSSARIAHQMLLVLFPYLHLKRPQAEIAIKFQLSINSLNRRRMNNDQTVVREAEAILVKSMNKAKRIQTI